MKGEKYFLGYSVPLANLLPNCQSFQKERESHDGPKRNEGELSRRAMDGTE
jgi:hypothetical protein